MNKVQQIQLILVLGLVLSSCVPGEMPVENPGPGKDDALIQVDNDQTQSASVPTSTVTLGPTSTPFPGPGDEIICEGNWSNSAVQPPTLPAEYLVDQNCLMEYFNAETSKDGTTTGTLPDGVTKVEFIDNVWVIRLENGADLVFNPLIVNESSKPSGYPVIYEKTVSGKTALMMAITDKDGTLVPEASIEPAFQSASEIAAKYGYSDENGAVKRIGIAANGQIIVYGENDAVLAKLKYSAGSPETIYPIPGFPVEIGRPAEALLSSAVDQFANAFRVKPEEVGYLTPQLLTGVDGKQIVVMTTGDLAATANFDESNTPLLIAEQGENGEWLWTDMKISLRTLADLENFNFGSAVVYYKLNDILYNEIIKGDFNIYVIDGELNVPDFWFAPPANETDLLNKYGNYDYSQADSIVSRAMENGAIVQAHHLLNADPDLSPGANDVGLPKWLATSSFSKEEYINIMQSRIKSAMIHFREKYPDVVQQYTVVNEAFDWTQFTGFWYEKIGPDFIKLAFQTARETDPNVQLIYNDTNGFNDKDRVDDHERVVFRLVKDLKSKGLIDGVGIQMHLKSNNIPSPEIFRQLIDMYKSIEIKVYITEFDIDFSNFNGSENDKQALKAKIYGQMFQVALEERVDGFATFGFTGEAAWHPDGLLFDASYQPSPAFYAVAFDLITQYPVSK